MYFPSTVLPEDLQRAIHNPTERLVWDKELSKGEVIEVVQDGKVLLWY